MQKQTSPFFVLIVLLVFAANGCVDSRLVEEPPTDKNQKPSEQKSDKDGHLHEDGNWYAGWAFPVSEELTSVATVEDEMIYVPRDRFFDLEIGALGPMDIMVGASESNGFIKRVLAIHQTEERWEISVMDASLTDVFIEGSFRFDVPADEIEPSTTAQDISEDEDVSTFRQRMQSDEPAETEIEEPCNDKCSSDSEATDTEATAGFDITWNPNIKPSGDEALKARTLLRYDSGFPEEKKEHEEMCQELSELWTKHAKEFGDYLREAKKAGAASGDVVVEREKEDILKVKREMMGWALKYAGHSPFPPFRPLNTPGDVRIQKTYGSTCPSTGNSPRVPLRQFREEGEHQCYNDFEEGNRFVVDTSTSSGETYDYGLFPAADDTRFREKGGGRFYHAMTPGYTAATLELAQEIGANSRLNKTFVQRVPESLINQSAAIVGDDPVTFPDLDTKYRDVGIHLQDGERNRHWREILKTTDPSLTERVLSPFQQDSIEGLFERRVTRDLKWLYASMAVGKVYCSGGDVKSAKLGAGLKLNFTWSPKITFAMKAGAKPDKKVKLAKTAKTFAVGPIPVYLELILNLNFRAATEVSLEAGVQVREHLAEIDFFYGVDLKEGPDWKLLTLGTYEPDLKDQKDAQGKKVRTGGGNKLRLLESPQPGITSEEYRQNEPVLKLSAELKGTAGFQLGLGIEAVLYKVFGAGFSLNFGTELSGAIDLTNGNISMDLEQGPTAELSSGFKLPICPAGAKECPAAEALKKFCDVGNGLICANNSICGKRPWVCPSLDADAQEFGIRIPLFDGCRFAPWRESEPLCDGQNWEVVPRAVPPCFKACYQSNPGSGHRWIALQNPKYGVWPTTHSWAGTCEETEGFSLDHIYIQKDGSGILRPKRILKDQDLRGDQRNAIGQHALQSVVPCVNAESSCVRDVNACEKEQLRDRTLHFRDTLLIEFDGEIALNDRLVILPLGIGRTQNVDSQTCGYGQVVNVLVGEGVGDGDRWAPLGETPDTVMKYEIPIDEFSTDQSRIKTRDLSTAINTCE